MVQYQGRMKLYWRYKKDGKWTWRAATAEDLKRKPANGEMLCDMKWHLDSEEEE